MPQVMMLPADDIQVSHPLPAQPLVGLVMDVERLPATAEMVKLTTWLLTEFLRSPTPPRCCLEVRSVLTHSAARGAPVHRLPTTDTQPRNRLIPTPLAA